MEALRTVVAIAQKGEKIIISKFINDLEDVSVSAMRYVGLLEWGKKVLRVMLPGISHILAKPRKTAKPEEAVLQKKCS